MSGDDDEDWFERALRELDEEDPASDTAEEEHVQDDSSRSSQEHEPEARDGSGAEDGSGDEDDPNGDAESRSDDAADTSPDQSPDAIGDGPERRDDSDTGSFGDGDPFGGGGEASGEGDPFGGGGGSSGESDPFGGGGGEASAESDPFGGGGGSSGESDPFGGGGGSFGEGDPFGGGGGSFGENDPFGGSRSTDTETPGGFDEAAAEELDSDIDRTDIGIAGLDEMILGGLPTRSLLSVIGGAGTGKTTFALQFLNEALESGDRGVYITLEQTRESILSTAEEKGWSFRDHVEAGRLAVVALDPIEMANSLASIRNDLARLIESFEADRLVLDSVSLLEMMYDHPAKRRSEVFGFTRSLKEAGMTTLLTSEASDESSYSSRYGIVEYLTDAVFVLQYVRGSDFRETRLAVEIQKIRNANHSRETKPYEITNSGISVYRQANIF